ncbi:ribonuclease H-like domain-containing protein [Lentinula raphanica]|nr:ribonuclease H-like domain-containing protein [Lentinula raphanica]
MNTVNQIPAPANFLRANRVHAIACVNVGTGPEGRIPMLARIAVVDFDGNSIIDTYVMPTAQVTDYRTATTGIQDVHLFSGNAVAFNDVQLHVANIIRDHILVGHSIWNDFSVLGMRHPIIDTRDVALYQPFRVALNSPNDVPSLQILSSRFSYRDFLEDGRPVSLENARMALDLYRWHIINLESSTRPIWPFYDPPDAYEHHYLWP